jgi:hypothetical protein
MVSPSPRTARETDSAPVIYREEDLTGAKAVSPEAQPQAAEDAAHLKEALEVFFGPPTRPDAWPEPPPVTGACAASEGADECSAEIYANTELDERLLPPDLRGFAKITGYWPWKSMDADASGAVAAAAVVHTPIGEALIWR